MKRKSDHDSYKDRVDELLADPTRKIIGVVRTEYENDENAVITIKTAPREADE